MILHRWIEWKIIIQKSKYSTGPTDREQNRRIVTNANDSQIEKEIRDESQQDQFEEFDGLVHIVLDMLLPKSYF